MSRLRRADCGTPGISRSRRGRGFEYLDAAGGRVEDAATLERIRALVIPPAWTDVWICPDPNGHLQAVGTDAAGRRQYRYHDEWRRARDVVKYERVRTLGATLAEVRTEIVRRLHEPGLGRERVLAGAVRMLDIGVFRAGGEQYAPSDDDDDGTFGLATLRREHVSLHRGAVVFDYPAKGNIPRSLELRDPLLHRLVGSLLRRKGGGEELLAYRVGREWCDVRTADLNGAVKELAGEEYTCKDLRTWNATVLAAVALAAGAAEKGVPGSERGRKRLVTAAVKQVAEHLGNTPTVARSSYVDPRVLDRFDDGRTVLAALKKLDGAVPVSGDDAGRATLERAVVKLLEG